MLSVYTAQQPGNKSGVGSSVYIRPGLSIYLSCILVTHKGHMSTYSDLEQEMTSLNRRVHRLEWQLKDQSGPRGTSPLQHLHRTMRGWQHEDISQMAGWAIITVTLLSLLV